MTVTLLDYLENIKKLIQNYSAPVWLSCEIRNMNSKGGHTYFELAQKDGDAVVASCRATLWISNKYVLKKFKDETGWHLSSGLAVLLKVNASFHSQFGFALNITDIEPAFTIGALAQSYQKNAGTSKKRGVD